MAQEFFNEEKLIITTILLVVVLLLFMSALIIVFFYFSRKKIILKELEKRDLEISHQKALLHATILTQEKERKRIARDLHDDISAKLNVVSLNSHLLYDADKLTKEEQKEIAEGIVEMTGKALECSRRIAHDLLPPVLEKFGLEAAIQELCVEVASLKNMKVQKKIRCSFEKLDKREQLHIFRILQELINNSLKHGNPTQIGISATLEVGKICFEYTDDGVGFTIENGSLKKGLGLKNMESRTELLKGTIKFDSSLGEGMRARIYV